MKKTIQFKMMTALVAAYLLNGNILGSNNDCTYRCTFLHSVERSFQLITPFLDPV
jgi:hypothetical protein